MYLAELKLWNFRKYGGSDWNLETPHLMVPFNEGLNVLIGENDSGKTAILDAIKIVLKTHAYEWIKIEVDDFFNGSDKLRIELLFKGFKDEEAKNFTEWLGWEVINENGEEKPIPVLRLIYQVEYDNGSRRILPADIMAGMDDIGYPLNAEAKEYLKCTYLKALRDADNELNAKRNSRVSQILLGHKLFNSSSHDFVQKFKELNKYIKDWFENSDKLDGNESNIEQIKGVIDSFLAKFIDDSTKSDLLLSDPDIKAILEKISLTIADAKNLGLGTMNRLFMAAELLHLRKQWDGLKLCLIEELEAHLHPQAQMKVISTLQEEKDVQFILTTHSPNLASKVKIENIILCHRNDVYSLAKGRTKLEDRDYNNLTTFLDVTKSNLFFAKGVLIIEGWSEEILLPIIADKLGFNLTKHEVSIVNVGSTAYLKFAKIFLRNETKNDMINIPVAIVTDLDTQPTDEGVFDVNQQKNKKSKIEFNVGNLTNSKVILNIAKEWTLEWCLYKSTSLGEVFRQSVSEVHSKTRSFKKTNTGWNENFERTLISKLKKGKGNSPLDKVAVALKLAEKIKKIDIPIEKNDDYLKYIIESIKHVCNNR
ncbi:MAG: AAA family ATPase [Bacteroidales bacterium]|nr:AAA family ATPase [Bacteroidales bacterium]